MTLLGNPHNIPPAPQGHWICKEELPPKMPEHDSVNHPKHYTEHPSGVECITITRHMNFNLGNVIKYLWRCHSKHMSPLEDLKKARWYLNNEISRLEGK